jgi:lysophospholipase L1-like esterase
MMYLKRLIIVFIITCFAAYITGSLFDHIYKKRWSVLFFEKSDALIKDTTNYDIIFLGNSRANFGINPYYIDSITKLTSYNFGNGGADAEDIALSCNLYLQKHPCPRLVIISLDGGSLAQKKTLQTRFNYLFYLENDTINKYMKRTGFLTQLIKVFPFMKYSFFDEYNRTSLFVKGAPYPLFDHNIYKGFVNIDQKKNARAVAHFDNGNDSGNYVWNAGIDYLRNIVSTLQRKGSRVIFVSPPERSSSPGRLRAFKKITDSILIGIANEYHLNYLHFDDPKLYADDYFIDDIHLNEPGTKIYSQQLADSIKSIYLIKQ